MAELRAIDNPGKSQKKKKSANVHITSVVSARIEMFSKITGRQGTFSGLSLYAFTYTTHIFYILEKSHSKSIVRHLKGSID